MRTVLAGQPLPVTDILLGFGLDAVYVAAAFAFFGYMFSLARQRGLLVKAQD